MMDFDELIFRQGHSKGELDGDKIANLGRAITAQSGLLLDCYTAAIPSQTLTKTKAYQTLKAFGVISETSGYTKISPTFRDILDIIAQKMRRQHTIPDIEAWKQDLKAKSDLVNHTQTNPAAQSDTNRYLMHIYQMCDDLAETLAYEMNAIEYIIYAELASTHDLHSKRLILKALIGKMTTQTEKLSSLSYDELQACHSGNTTINHILQQVLLPSIDKALQNFQNHLQKTIALLDTINERLSQNKTKLWQVYTAIKNASFDPSMVVLSYNELMDDGLLVGGLGFAPNQNVDVSDKPLDIALLHAIINHLPEPKTPKPKENKHSSEPLQTTQGSQKTSLGSLTPYVFDFLKEANHKPPQDTATAKSFWQNHLPQKIAFKPFLALVLHTLHSDFLHPTVIYEKENFIWQLFLKFEPQPACHTKHITDARIIHYHKSQSSEVADFIANW